MNGWTRILRLRVISERTAARAVSLAMYGGSLAVVIFGIRGLVRLDPTAKELFLGVLLVTNLAMTFALSGFMIDLLPRIAGKTSEANRGGVRNA